jgi:hypothetical protein
MWAKFINTILGLWLMVAPNLLGYGGAAADNGYIVGPIIATFSIIALWEATDAVHKWNYPFALWLLLAPWVLGYDNAFAIVSDIATGVLVIILSSVRQKMKHRFGGGWISLWKNNPDHIRYRAKKNDDVG